MLHSITINLIEHDHGVHAYVWRLEQEMRHRNRRQVAVVFLPGASIFGPPVSVVEALLASLKERLEPPAARAPEEPPEPPVGATGASGFEPSTLT